MPCCATTALKSASATILAILEGGVVQKVLGNTGNVNFGWLTYDSTDGHPKKCRF
jgi:hypothetical protein